MIKGELENGDRIPSRVRKGFALLNYCIESCLTGASYVDHMNTNVIVHYLYESMKGLPRIFDKVHALPKHSTPGNSLAFVETMTLFFEFKSIRVLIFGSFNETRIFLDSNFLFAETAVIRPDSITQLNIIKNGKPPDLLIVPYDVHYMKDRNKYYFLKLNQYKYKLDCITVSASNKSGVGHVSALITINGKFYHYDGDGDRGVKIKECNWKHWLNVQNAVNFQISKKVA
jgi:hypothetical protein